MAAFLFVFYCVLLCLYLPTLQDTILRDDCRYMVRSGRGVSSLTIHAVTADDSAKYTSVVRNAISAHAGFASLSVEGLHYLHHAACNV